MVLTSCSANSQEICQNILNTYKAWNNKILCRASQNAVREKCVIFCRIVYRSMLTIAHIRRLGSTAVNPRRLRASGGSSNWYCQSQDISNAAKKWLLPLRARAASCSGAPRPGPPKNCQKGSSQQWRWKPRLNWDSRSRLGLRFASVTFIISSD